MSFRSRCSRVGPAGDRPAAGRAETPEAALDSAGWRVGDDVHHSGYGHGWVQGAGHGVVSVRFETRASGPGVMRTFALEAAELTPADPVDSLDWL